VKSKERKCVEFRNMMMNVERAQEKRQVEMTIEEAHERLGHQDEESTRKIATRLGWKIKSETMEKCKACVADERKYRDVPKCSGSGSVTSTQENERTGVNRIYLGTVTVRQELGEVNSELDGRDRLGLAHHGV
jgi:hypothetical protein